MPYTTDITYIQAGERIQGDTVSGNTVTNQGIANRAYRQIQENISTVRASTQSLKQSVAIGNHSIRLLGEIPISSFYQDWGAVFSDGDDLFVYTSKTFNNHVIYVIDTQDFSNTRELDAGSSTQTNYNNTEYVIGGTLHSDGNVYLFNNQKELYRIDIAANPSSPDVFFPHFQIDITNLRNVGCLFSHEERLYSVGTISGTGNPNLYQFPEVLTGPTLGTHGINLNFVGRTDVVSATSYQGLILVTTVTGDIYIADTEDISLHTKLWDLREILGENDPIPGYRGLTVYNGNLYLAQFEPHPSRGGPIIRIYEITKV